MSKKAIEKLRKELSEGRITVRHFYNELMEMGMSVQEMKVEWDKVEFVSFSAKTLGSIKSEKKAKSSRENGKLGGRPKNK